LAVLWALVVYNDLLPFMGANDMKMFFNRSAFFYLLWVIALLFFSVNSSAYANVTVDNRDAATSRTGTWERSGGTNPFNPSDPAADSLWARGGADTFSWHFTPSQTGAYEVWEWHSGWSTRTNVAPHRITHAGGTNNIVVNQKINAGKWNRLGVYQFTAGKSYRVTVTSVANDSSTCADAVRWTLVTSGNNPPTAKIDSISPSFANAGEPVTFAGSGTDSDGSIAAYRWISTISGTLSSSKSFSTSGLAVGTHTITFQVQDNKGAWSAPATRNLTINRLNASDEHIYYCMGFGGGTNPVRQMESWLTNNGGKKEGDLWTYTNAQGKKHIFHFVLDKEGMRQALMTEGAHVLYRGHANYGLGAVFPTAEERRTNIIDNIYYIDDPRILNFSTPWLSVNVYDLKKKHAFPNWWPIFKNGTSGIMPYDFGQVAGVSPYYYNTPAYNYYITYQIPGDPTHYLVESFNFGAIKRFPDSSASAWYSTDGKKPNAKDSRHAKYFITKPGPWKPLFQSNTYPQVHYGSKVVLFNKAPDITKNQMRYKRLFYEACNSGNYYLGTFNRGVVFYALSTSNAKGFYVYLKNYMDGNSNEVIWKRMQDREPIYDYYDFNKLPSQQ
jgi:hypothetical protein